jgi:hypothetical protein
VLEVIPERLTFDDNLFDCRHRIQHVDVAKTLPAETAQRPAQFLCLPAHDMFAKVPLGTALVARLAELFRHIQDNRHWDHMILPRQRHQRLARLWLHVGGVDDGQAASSEPFGGDELEHIKRVNGGRLIVFVVGHQSAAEVG